MDYVTGILGQNAACSGMQQSLARLATAAAATWRRQVEQAAQQAISLLGAQVKAATLQEHVWERLAASRRALIASSVQQVRLPDVHTVHHGCDVSLVWHGKI